MNGDLGLEIGDWAQSPILNPHIINLNINILQVFKNIFLIRFFFQLFKENYIIRKILCLVFKKIINYF